MKRIESLPRTRELRAEPEMPSLEELRGRLGRHLSCEEFLLRATMPGGQVDAMLAAGPARRHYNPELSPVLDLIRRLTACDDLDYVAVDKEGVRLELRRHTVRNAAEHRAGAGAGAGAGA
jgi:oxaloacetate decarboxylase alpha subunit